MTPMLPTSGAMAGGRTPRDASTTMGRSEEARTAASASETQATRRAVSRSGTMIASDLLPNGAKPVINKIAFNKMNAKRKILKYNLLFFTVCSIFSPLLSLSRPNSTVLQTMHRSILYSFHILSLFYKYPYLALTSPFHVYLFHVKHFYRLHIPLFLDTR